MLEDEYKYQVCLGLAGLGWDVQAHEDSISNYIPDLSFAINRIDGWIEVKYSDEPPKSLSRVPHWTKGQEAWLRKRGQTGSGFCYLLYGTAKFSYLWHWTALKLIRPATWEQATTAAIVGADSIPNIVQELDYYMFQGNKRERVNRAKESIFIQMKEQKE